MPFPPSLQILKYISTQLGQPGWWWWFSDETFFRLLIMYNVSLEKWKCDETWLCLPSPGIFPIWKTISSERPSMPQPPSLTMQTARNCLLRHFPPGRNCVEIYCVLIFIYCRRIRCSEFILFQIPQFHLTSCIAAVRSCEVGNLFGGRSANGSQWLG